MMGPYRLVKRIGSGGQSTVWQAFKGEADEAVAVKVLRLSHPKKRARFVQEVTIHSALSAANAPNIMPLLDHSLEETANNGVKGYIVMPLAEVSLHDVIDTLRDRLELSLELLCGIATGLAAAHKAGVVHRDLKPANVLFTNRALRDPLISDFGICLLRETPEQDRITDIGETVGAKYFMAPEQEHGGVSEVTFAADVYAAGKLLHFMLTGRYLVRERLETAFTSNELAREPRLQIVLDELIGRCVIEDPSQRLQTGAELLDVAQRVLGSFRAPSGARSNGGSFRKLYDAFAQSLTPDDPRSTSLAFDELQDDLRAHWDELRQRLAGGSEDVATAAEDYVRSQSAPLAAALAMARVDAEAAFPHFKRLLEFTTELSEDIAGYAAIASIPHVEAGFLYMSCSLFALQHESWGVLERLLSAKFKWVYQSARAHYSYGFAHPYFFHSETLQREATRHNDVYRSLLMEPPILEVTRLDKERLLNAYAQTDLLMSLRAAQLEARGEDASRWADFGRFYEARVMPLLERIQHDSDYAAGALRAFGESRAEFLEQLDSRLQYIRQNFFGGSKYRYESLRGWAAR
ncbi:MAG: serine/threonine-protein kinase [Thermoanaerobaculia bacterium]